jgi:hypothetical protein
MKMDTPKRILLDLTDFTAGRPVRGCAIQTKVSAGNKGRSYLALEGTPSALGEPSGLFSLSRLGELEALEAMTSILVEAVHELIFPCSGLGFDVGSSGSDAAVCGACTIRAF